MRTFDVVLSSYDTFLCENEKELKRLCKFLSARGYYTPQGKSVFSYLHVPTQFPEVYKVNKITRRMHKGEVTTDFIFKNAEYAVTMSEIGLMLKSGDTSTRTWVRNHLPESWLQAARKFKCKEEMIRRICAAIPTIYRNRFHSKESKIYVTKRIFGVKTHIRHLIDMSDADIVKWNEVGNFIINYEESCR